MTKSGPSVPAKSAPVAKIVHRSKWEGEDEEDDGPDTGVATSQLRHFVIQVGISASVKADLT